MLGLALCNGALGDSNIIMQKLTHIVVENRLYPHLTFTCCRHSCQGVQHFYLGYVTPIKCLDLDHTVVKSSSRAGERHHFIGYLEEEAPVY